MIPRGLLLLAALAASASAEAAPEAEPQYWALKPGPSGHRECPPVTERPAYECAGAAANCWSPGVRDTGSWLAVRLTVWLGMAYLDYRYRRGGDTVCYIALSNSVRMKESCRSMLISFPTRSSSLFQTVPATDSAASTDASPPA